MRGLVVTVTDLPASCCLDGAVDDLRPGDCGLLVSPVDPPVPVHQLPLLSGHLPPATGNLYFFKLIDAK